jgi:hypothetical protein
MEYINGSIPLSDKIIFRATGNYSNNSVRTLTLTTARNISSNPVTILSFYHRFDIEIMDNAYVEVSSDGGTSWNSVKYYYGIQNEWTQEVLDITSWLTNKSENSVYMANMQVADGCMLMILRSRITWMSNGISRIRIPLSFALELSKSVQSVTTIISAPKSEFVRISLYDALGIRQEYC